ncbi:protein kinase C delta type-like [Hyla sarda]|uniref:protein kinase C delta type-like n=1 Tax=Hyla sarda TaxID=327740 RepID=UPI0024C228CF|nr:protein kinase C delta type-like [Hyla sarda]
MELYLIALPIVLLALLVIGVILYICIKKKYKATEDGNLTEVVIETPKNKKQSAEDDLKEVVVETPNKENQPAEDQPAEDQPAEDQNIEVLVEKPADNQKDSASEKCVSKDDFIFHKVLGKGGYGTVVLSQLKGKNEFFAIKALKKRRVKKKEAPMIEKRILALAWEHPFLTRLYCSFQTKKHLFFVMELLNGGDLLGHLNDQRRFDLPRATFYAAEISSGLQFLHSKNIIHGDLKLQNVMLDKDGHIKITDFGLSIENISNGRKANSFGGTPVYKAPEMVLKQSYTFTVDWWAFGVLLYTMLIGELPFLGRNKRETYNLIKEHTPNYPSWITEESRDILQQLLEKDPTKRLGVADNIRRHPFFNTINWTALERREVEPPYKPKVQSPSEIRSFDQKDLNKNDLISCNEDQVDSTNNTEFCGFSFIHPEMQEILDS